MDAKAEAALLVAALRRQRDPAYAAGAKAYLKVDLDFLGARTPEVRKAASAWLRAHRGITRTQLLAVLKALWAEPAFEPRLLASILAARRVDLLDARDLPWLERVLRQCRTWAFVDNWAPTVAGPILRRDPALRRRVLHKWIRDEDSWVRRAAVLAMHLELRRGDGDWPLFVELADAVLDEKEFFLRKAVGWMLRVRCATRPQDVVAFLEPRMGRAAGLTVREATRRLPAAHQRRLGLATRP